MSLWAVTVVLLMLLLLLLLLLLVFLQILTCHPSNNHHHPNRRAYAQQKARQVQVASHALRQSEIFKAHDDKDGVAAIFMASLQIGCSAHASEFLFLFFVCVYG
jgi:hypothetical protein